MPVVAETERLKPQEGLCAEYQVGPVALSNIDLSTHFRASGDVVVSSLTPEDISRKTGINTRYRLQPIGAEPLPRLTTVPMMAANVGARLLKERSIDPRSIDLLAVISTYPLTDPQDPERKIEISNEVANILGATHCETADIYAGCAGPAFFLHELKRRGYRSGSTVLALAADHYSPDLTIGMDEAIFSDMCSGFLAQGKDLTIEDSIVDHEPSDAISFAIDENSYPSSAWVVRMPTGVRKFLMQGERVFKTIGKGPLIDMVRDQLKGDGSGEAIIPHQASGRLLDMLQSKLENAGVKGLFSRETLAKVGNGASASQFAELAAFLNTDNGKRVKSLVFAGVGAGILYSVVRVRLNKP